MKKKMMVMVMIYQVVVWIINSRCLDVMGPSYVFVNVIGRPYEYANVIELPCESTELIRTS